MKSMRIALSCVLLALADATVPPPSPGATPSQGPTVIPPTSPAPAGPAEGTCDDPIMLDDITSPYSGSTESQPNSFDLTCGGSGNDATFAIELKPGAKLYIGQTENSYDSRHQLHYGSSMDGCGTEEGTVVVCRDDSDTEEESWTNNTGRPQTVFFTIDAWSDGNGTFTIAWRVDPAPAGTCDDPIVLDSPSFSMQSPYYGSTAGRGDAFELFCGGDESEVVFSIELQAGWTLLIGQTENHFDSVHQIQWGGCGDSGTIARCRDDSDTTEESWKNTTGATQTVYFTIDGYETGDYGSFVLAWRTTDWVYDYNTYLADAKTDETSNESTSGLLMYRGKPVCDADFQREDGITACNEMGMVYVGHKNDQEMDAWTAPPTDPATESATDEPTDWPSSTGPPRRRLIQSHPPTSVPSPEPGTMDAGLILGGLYCDGTESGLADCGTNPLVDPTRCDESDTGVKLFCHRSTEGVSISEEGFLMYDGAYVCDDGWGMNGAIGSGSWSSGSGDRRRLGGGLYYGSEYDAGSSGDWWHGDYNLNVVCRELGFSSEGGTWIDSVDLPNGIFGMDDVDCEGHEERLSDCRHTTYHNCSAGEGIKVSCGAKLTHSEAWETVLADALPSDGFCEFSENCGWMEAMRAASQQMMDRIETLETNLAAVASGGIWLDYCDTFVTKSQNKHYNKCEKMRVNDRYDQTKKENKCAKMEFCSWGVEDGADLPTCNYICPSSVPGDMPTTGPTSGMM